MSQASIIGWGSTEFGSHDEGIKELASSAAKQAFETSDVTQEDIDALYIGNYMSGVAAGQEALGPILADTIGLDGVPAMKTEGACASAGIAFHQARQMIEAEVYDVVIAVGAEKMTNIPTDEFTAALSAAMDQDAERLTGLTFPGFYALFLDRYLHEYDASRKDIARVAVKNRQNAANNPRAQFTEPISVDDVLSSRKIADPLRLYDCSPAADGAAAVILANTDIAEELIDNPVPVQATTHTTGRRGAYRYQDLTEFEATTEAARQAYEQAGVSPMDIDVVELHDCFTPAEIGDSEDLGFFEKGTGAKHVVDGTTAVDGEIPINPSGGLLSKGHPVGATGIGQIYETILQLRGEHENQVDSADLGLTHNLGGSGVVCTVTILGEKQ